MPQLSRVNYELTTTRLRELALDQGIGSRLDLTKPKDLRQFNKEVGRAFQSFALDSIHETENNEPFRSDARGKGTWERHQNTHKEYVVPDAVGSVHEVRM